MSVRVKRILLIAAAAAALPLLLFLALLVIRGVVSSRLSRLDPECTIGSVGLGPGLVVLTGTSLPGYGFGAEVVFIYWHGNPLSPSLDSILVGSSILEAEVCLTGREGTGNGSGNRLPPVRIGGLEVRNCGESMGIITGRLSGWGSGERFDGCISGEWGSAGVSIEFRNGADSLRMVFMDCECPPPGTITLPSRLSGHRVSGELSGLASHGFIEMSGFLSAVDGSPVDIPFSYSSVDGDVRADLHLDISSADEFIEARFDSLFPGAFMETSPSGSFVVTMSGSDSILFEVDVLLDSTRFWSPILARDTVDLILSVECRGVYLPVGSSVHLDSGTVMLGEANAGFRIDAYWGERQNLFLRLWNDSLPGSSISSSIPDPLLGRLRGLRLGGELSFDIGLLLNWIDPDSSDVWIDIDVSGLEVESSPIRFGQLRGDGATCLMRDSWGNSRLICLDTLANADFIVFDSLPASFEALVCCAEDASFRWHDGFSLYHIRNSIRADIEEGRLARGGSTITMQLAKNLFLGRERTFARKLQEVFLTWRIEVYLSKDRILELYANIVELGPDVFGLQEAAGYYFGVDVRDLSVRQTAFLVSILPGPRLYHRLAVSGSLPAYWDAYLDRLISISKDRGWLSSGIALDALEETLVFILDQHE